MEPPDEQLPELVDLLATDLDRYFPQLVLSTQQRLSNALHLTPQQILEQLKQRGSLSAVAVAQGVSASQLYTIEMNAFNQIINDASKMGKIDSQSANIWIAQLQKDSGLRDKIILSLLNSAPTP